VFEKMHKYIGKSIKNLIERPDDPHCLRLHKNVRIASPLRRWLHSSAAAPPNHTRHPPVLSEVRCVHRGCSTCVRTSCVAL
jgi:hypothetical protein